jgi:hypothetical protein
MRQLILSLIFLFGISATFAQTARIQIIHNAADPAAQEVDVYVNDDLALDDFAFRAATPFIDLPAGVTLNIGIAPGNSNSVNDTIKNFPVILEENETYVAIANGVLDSDSFSANPDGKDISFTIFANDNVREKGKRFWGVDFIVLHGATDAPTVDIIAKRVYHPFGKDLTGDTETKEYSDEQAGFFWDKKIVNDASYGDITSYKRLLARQYILKVTPGNDNKNVVAKFDANLNGLGGGAAIVFASGFLNPGANQNGAPFGIFAALPDGNVVEFPAIVPMARLQVIHNAADPIANEVDVYINGSLALDNFAFRGATPFIDVPAGVTLNIGIAPGNSTSVSDTIKNFPVQFEEGETYVAVANGVVDPSGFAPNPDGRDISFTIFAKNGIRERGRYNSKVDFIVLHGSTDAPTVDVIARDVAKIVDDAAYSDFTDYIRVWADSYILDITPGDDNKTIVASFEADLSGLGGSTAVVFASGFLDPASNQNGEAFGLFAALADGNVVPLPAIEPAARLQVIHNAADPVASEVDVYINGNLALDDFAFRKATPFIDVPAGVTLNIGIAPGNSTSVDDTIKNFPVQFEDGETYVAVANGVIDPSGFAPNPDGRDISFAIFAKDDIREKGENNHKVDFIVLHGSTDAPTVDVIARDVATIVDDAAYGDITDYIRVPAGNYILDITPGDDNNTIVASFRADLSGLGGGAAVVFASGFLNPSANQNGEAFGLFAALPDGNVAQFPALEPFARLQVIHNAADPLASEVDVYLNGDLALDDFAFRTATPYIDVPAGVPVNIGVAPGNSTSVDDVIKNFEVEFASGGTYVALANGVVDPSGFAPNPDGRDISFTLFAKDDAREQSKNGNKVDLFVVHGSTDAPTVNIYGLGIYLNQVGYGDISNYLSLSAWRNWIVITTPRPNYSIVGVWGADLRGLGGNSAVVFASGFLSPSDNQNGEAFGLFVALADGNVVELPKIYGKEAQNTISKVMNENDDITTVTDYGLEQNYPNPFNPSTTIKFSIPQNEFVTLKVYDILGNEVADLVNEQTVAGSYEVRFDASNLASGIYVYTLKAGNFSQTSKLMLMK